MIAGLSSLPVLGVGLGYRRELHAAIMATEEIDFLEIIADQFTHPQTDDLLDELASRYQLIPHGIGLSIGSCEPLDRTYLAGIRRVSERTRAPYYSEHLCTTHSPGVDIGHLAPIVLSEAMLALCIDRCAAVQDALGKPLVLENITYPFDIPGAEMSQAVFLTRLLEATGGGLLCDLTNIHVNATNHGFDAESFLEQLPLDRIVQVHLAGGFWADGVLVDGHCRSVDEDSWTLLGLVAGRTHVRGCIIEHDADFPDDPAALIHQLTRARRVLFGEVRGS